MSDERVCDSCTDCDLLTVNICDQVELVCYIECWSKQLVFTCDEYQIFPCDLQGYCHISLHCYGCVCVACLENILTETFARVRFCAVLYEMQLPTESFLGLTSFCKLLVLVHLS